MMKQCVFLNGQVINIGPWDYQIQPFEISPAELDNDGNVITEAVYEDRPTNPLPEGATIEERDFEYTDQHGWRLAGIPLPKTDAQRIAELEEENLTNMLALVELHGMILTLGGGS